MANSILKYYKHSQTGQLICEQTIISDVINNIPKYYYDLYMRKIGEEFDLTGFQEIKKKKFDLYRTRWNTTEINSWIKKETEQIPISEVRQDKLDKINKIFKR